MYDPNKQVKRVIDGIIITYDGYEFCRTLPFEYSQESFNEWKKNNKDAYAKAKLEMKAEFAKLPDIGEIID